MKSSHSWASCSTITWRQQPGKTMPLPVLVAQWQMSFLLCSRCPSFKKQFFYSCYIVWSVFTPGTLQGLISGAWCWSLLYFFQERLCYAEIELNGVFLSFPSVLAAEQGSLALWHDLAVHLSHLGNVQVNVQVNYNNSAYTKAPVPNRH